LRGGVQMKDLVIVVSTMIVFIYLLLWLKRELKKDEAKEHVRNISILHPDVISCAGLLLALVAMGLFRLGFGIIVVIPYIISSFLDGVDGAMARAWGRDDKKYGKFIDAFFDKIRYFPPLLFFAFIGFLPGNVIKVFLLVDLVIGQFVARVIILIMERYLNRKLTIGSNYFGKVKTVLADLLNVYCYLLYRGVSLPSFLVNVIYLVFALSICSIIFKFVSFEKIVIEPSSRLLSATAVIVSELKKNFIKPFFGRTAPK